MESMNARLKAPSEYIYNKLQGVRGVEPIKANAAMYMMIRIHPQEFKDIADDVEFAQKLIKEQCVMVIPSDCFLAKNFFRIIICTSVETMEDFGNRIVDFCKDHYA